MAAEVPSDVGEVEAALLACEGVAQAAVIAGAPGDHVTAYVVLDHAAVQVAEARDAAKRDASLRQWASVFENTYHEVAAAEPSFLGWQSSYSGEPIPEAEMKLWLDETVERVKALGPCDVLEIGCGIGLVLGRVAPMCRSYLGADIAPQAVAALQKYVDTRPDLRHVHLTPGEATDSLGLHPGAVDTVVLNSVVQYFPDAEYLLAVLATAVEVLGGRGRIFVGDIRHRGLLEVFQSSVQLAWAPDTLSAPMLRRRVSRVVERERELLLDPAFFAALPAQIPAISAARIALKRANSSNELSRYRYDAVIEVGGPVAPRPEAEFPWDDGKSSLGEIEAWLATLGRASARVIGVANARLARDLAGWRLIGHASDAATAADLRGDVAAVAETGEEPGRFWELGERLGYDVEVSWSGEGPLGSFDVDFIDPARRSIGPSPSEKGAAAGPAAGAGAGGMERRLRASLLSRLAVSRIPSTFLFVDSLPRVADGGVDPAG